MAEEVISWLHDHGYRMQTIDNVSRDVQGRAVQVDVLFARR